MERMRWIWPCAIALASLAGCKSQERSCLYPTASAYSPGQPGSESLTAKVILPDGQEHSATAALSAATSVDGGTRGGTTRLEGDIRGRVSESSAGEVVVDTCDASTGCQPTLYRLAAAAPGLTLAIPVGRDVSATWTFGSGAWVSSQQVAILDGSGGADSTDGTRAIWLWAVDPSMGGDVAGLFQVETQELFCNPSPGTRHPCGDFSPPDDYAFRFSATSGGAQVTLATSQSGTLTVLTTSGQEQHLTVHDLRSYQSGKCDDYWNWAWWAAGHPGTSGTPE